MKYLLYGAIGIFVLYTILKPTSVDLVIDNPTSQSLTVSVDELTVEVPGNEVVWVYLVNEHFYGDMMSQLSYMQTSPDKKVDYLGIELEGRYDVINTLISQVTWDVGAREPMPESVQADEGDSYVVLKKLMDPNEFNQMLQAEIEAAAAEAEEKEAG